MVAKYPLATILEYSAGKWDLRRKVPINSSDLPEICYIFLDVESYPKSESDRRRLLRPFKAPDFLSNDTCTKANGYFGCKGTYSEEGELEGYTTWFRCLVKVVEQVEKKSPINYHWNEMGFFTRWDRSGRCMVLCIDTPDKLRRELETALDDSPELGDPFAMHVPLIDQIVKLYDDSVWLVRDPVRDLEKNRRGSGPDFEQLHEMSRHAIHVSEVLTVSVRTLQRMQQQQQDIYKSLPNLGKTYEIQAQEYMAFQVQMLESFLLRSNSNHERLKNEITAAYNIITQQDNNVMKSIALLTMVFLPATFVSAIFSTTFFSFTETGWKASGKIWIYLVVTIMATLVTVGAWRMWLRGSIQAIKSRLRSKFFDKKNKKRRSETEGTSV